MSLGDRFRGMLDPLHPAVREWLQRELPRLTSEGYLNPAQADLIARRYGVTVGSGDATRADAQPPLTETPPAAATDTVPGPAASTPPAASDPVIGTIGGPFGRPPGGPAGIPPAWGTLSPPPGGPGAAPGQPPYGQGPYGPPQGPGPGPRHPAARPAATPFVADHAVSIVLYLGAFLVVAAVIIFLAYSWGEMSSGARLAVLALLTGGFLAAAAICLPRPSVRPAGRTFLALGAILVPANIAGLYLVYFQDSPIPPAVFWLLGAAISGGLHAALSVRLRSYAYGVLAVLAVPVAASAFGWLIEPDWSWIGTSAAAGLVLTLAVARYAPPIPLVQVARVVGAGLLVLAFLVTLPALSERNLGQLSTPIALVLMSGGLAWEALRRGKTWWFGAAAGFATAPLIAIALGLEDRRYWFVDAIVLAGWVTVLTARRLAPRQRLIWDLAAILPATIYPLVTWDDDRASLQLFASLILLTGVVAWMQRTSLPLYIGVLAVDGAYIKLLDIYGSPDSPAWALGVALWPLAIIWTALGAFVPRRLSGPGWLGAALTMTVAVLITWDEPRWSLAIAASAAVATVLAGWRLGVGAILPLAGIWLLAAGYQGADLLKLELPWRFVVAGLTGWLLFAVSLVRPPGLPETRPTPEPTREPSAGPPAPSVLAGRTPLPLLRSTAAEWALAARLGAVGVGGFATLLLLTVLPNPAPARDSWLVAATVSWLDVALLLAAWALLSRSWLLALFSALAVAPALISGIARLHPDNAQAFAVPIGLYLVAVATVARRRRQPVIGSVIAAVGLAGLLGTSVLQSFDRDSFQYVLLALAEGLGLVGVGIAVRWRVLVVLGVAGTVVIALRQLFDAVSALPGWAILGGSGMLLLGIAVALLLVRARLAAAGQAVAERWSSWD